MGKQENSSDVSQSVLEVLSLCVSSLPGGRADVWLPHFFFFFFLHSSAPAVTAALIRCLQVSTDSLISLWHPAFGLSHLGNPPPHPVWPMTPEWPSSWGHMVKKIKHKNVSRSVLMKFSGHENLTKKWLSNRLDQDVSPLISQYLRFLEMAVHP